MHHVKRVKCMEIITPHSRKKKDKEIACTCDQLHKIFIFSSISHISHHRPYQIDSKTEKKKKRESRGSLSLSYSLFIIIDHSFGLARALKRESHR